MIINVNQFTYKYKHIMKKIIKDRYMHKQYRYKIL
jgi:hypothetical protein